MNIEKQLYEQKILELEKKLLESNNSLAYCQQEKEEFIYIASHDLKAPLRKLSTFAERLAQKSMDVLSEEALSYLQRIEITIKGMQSLIDGLSVLSNINAEDDFIKCDLNKLMDEVVKESAQIIKEKNASISVSSLPIIEAYPAQLKEVFKNLFDNSFTFQPEGQGPQINITSDLLTGEEKISFNLPVEKVYYQIKFQDNGIGFKQEYAEQILKPFERLHGRSAYPGNGLGLSISKKIINKHDGILYAQGNESAGSLFVLILPQIRQ